MNLIEHYFSQESTMRKFRCVTDFEVIYFASLIYFYLLKSVIDSS